MNAADLGGALVLGVEHRYPLRLESSLPELTAIYRASCRDRWDPETVVDGAAVRAAGAGIGHRAAAAAASAWEAAAWVDYTAITETDALLIRFCIEDAREPELKYLLTARGQGRALAAEACTLVARALAPAPMATGSRHGSLRSATSGLLSEAVPPDALVCGRLVLAEAVDVAVWEVALAHCEPAALRTVIERLLVDRRRMLEFGWSYAEVRLPRLEGDALSAVLASVPPFVDEERTAARCPALSSATSGGIDPAPGAELAARAGLGVAPAAAAAAAVVAAVAAALERLASLGIILDPKELHDLA